MKSHVARTLSLLPLFLLLPACAEGIGPVETAPVPREMATPIPELDSSYREVVLSNRLIPEETSCTHRGETPLSVEEAAELGFDHALTDRLPDFDEESGGLSTIEVDSLVDYIDISPSLGTIGPAPTAESMVYTLDWSSYWTWLLADTDGDCAVNLIEMNAGTNIYDPDTDDDGWFDGACNERRLLHIDWVKAHDEQEDIGSDELYFISDDIRYPSGDLDGSWDFDDGQSRTVSQTVAERTRGVNRYNYLRNVRIEAWEDDFEAANTWYPDDLLYTIDVNLGAYSDGQTFAIRKSYSDWDYELHFRVEVQYFADPNPLVNADTDGDGIVESAEYAVARDFGGITDPTQQDILVEIDWMSGHGLSTRAKRLVATRLYRHGYRPYLHRHQSISVDECLTRGEARNLYNTQFSYGGYGAFRYAVMTETLWNDASGVALGDTFFVDDSTWWINGGTLAQAGTLIHELGHTLSLTQAHTFRLIDTTAWFSYDSAMNYTFQPTMVDYSDSGSGGSSSDHNDWADVDPAYALRYSFGLTTGENVGACD